MNRSAWVRRAILNALFQRNEAIVVTRHDDVEFACRFQLVSQDHGKGQNDVLFFCLADTDSAGIDAAMTGVDDDDARVPSRAGSEARCRLGFSATCPGFGLGRGTCARLAARLDRQGLRPVCPTRPPSLGFAEAVSASVICGCQSALANL